MRTALLLIIMGAVGLGAAAGCSSSRAQTRIEDPPSLEVPPVPPRVIEPLPSNEPQAIEPVPELPTGPPASPPRTRPAPRDRAGTPPEAKPEAKAETPVDPAAAPPPTPAPVPPLRTGGTPPGPEVAQQVRESLIRANEMLKLVDYQNISNERKANYEAVKNFIMGAEEALKANNLTAAKGLADRAETTAKALIGK